VAGDRYRWAAVYADQGRDVKRSGGA